MDEIGKSISNLVKDQFPEHYRENGPLFVAFLQQYYTWLEGYSSSRDNWFTDKTYLVSVQNKSANVVGIGSIFTSQFANGDQIAISKGEITNDYEIFTINTVVSDTLLTLKHGKLPNFSHANTKYATVSDKENALYLTRNYADLHDIDNTLDKFVVYFKEKYLKGIQFKTITDTKTLVKHSLDLYRSKGTERSIDLLYKIAFGKPAKVYYPGQDIFRLSSGEWFIPRYLELSICDCNKDLVKKQITGVLSGATAFVEEIVRRNIGSRVTEIAYISAINGIFITGEKITLSDNSLVIATTPSVVGSLNAVEFDIMGSGSGFEIGDIVEIESILGRGGKGKVLETANTTGQITLTLADGGYGYSNTEQLANTTGNVSVESACSIITGTSTLFDSEYSNGDYISVWEDTGSYETHQIISINSNTEIQVDGFFSFTNTETKSAYTRYFAQTFISDKILTLNDVTFSPDYVNFEYFPFQGQITQPLAVLNYENATGDFTDGESIYTYEGGGAVKGEGRILSISKKTTTSGILTISLISGDMEDTFYTEANAISASLDVANGYTDITATANVIGNYANVTIVANGVVGEFDIGEEILQVASSSRGILTSATAAGNDYIIGITNSEGVFKSGFSVTGANSGATAGVIRTHIEVGVVNISNAFYTLTGNRIYADHMEGTLASVSSGSGLQVQFGNTIIYPEYFTFAIDYINPYLTLEVGATSWPFPANTSANLSSMIGNTMTYSSLTIGKVYEIVASSPGIDYNKIPIVRLHDPAMFSFSVPDTIVLAVTNTAGFTIGGVINQSATSARGMIKEKLDSETLVVQNMRYLSNNAFIATSNSTTTIVGEFSGYEANVVSVTTRPMSARMGADVTMLSTLTIGEGALTSIKVTDSGFAFANGEVVTITSGDKTAEGFAVLQTHGTGSGYYKDSGGFLSDDKKLSDGYYWQEYSYEVQSAVIDDFKKILKKIVHVAGTKSFDALIYDTINTFDTDISTTQSIGWITDMALRDGESLILLRNGTDIIRSGHENG